MKDDKLYLIHIQECISRIEEYVREGSEEFMASSLVQDAVLRNLQVLAESTQKLSDSLKAGHPEIDWRRISGFRNVLVHDYLGLDTEQVWSAIENDLPVLKAKVEALLGES